MKKRCGGCQHWQKVRFSDGYSGLCELFDARGGSGVPGCKEWKARPYSRDDLRINVKELLIE